MDKIIPRKYGATVPTIDEPKDALIFRLPPELLAMIAECAFEIMDSIENRFKGRNQLARLRLTHRNFAYLKPLLAKMFRSIILEPDLSRENFDWSTCGSYVERVTFSSVEIEKHNGLHRFTSGGHGYRLGQTLDPVAEAELCLVEQYVGSGRARRAFAKMLKEFTKLRHVKICVEPHDDGVYRPPSALGLFNLAVQSLKEAKVQPTELEISRYEPDEDTKIRLWHLPDWPHLNFARVEVLDFGDHKEFDYEPGYGEDLSTWPMDECDSLLEAVEQCAGTLRDIRLMVSKVALWPQHFKIPQFPRLEAIEIEQSWISPETIATWILRSPLLEQINLEHFTVVGVDEIDCRISHLGPIFHALRAHPNTIEYQIATDLCDPFGRGDIFFCLTNEHFDDEEYQYSKDEDMESMIKMLKDYISGDGDWSPPTDASSW